MKHGVRGIYRAKSRRILKSNLLHAMSRMYCRLSRLVFAAAAVLFGAGCTTVTSPERRIAADPAAFEALSAKHQALVREGQVAEGLSKGAVQLAWGRPHEVRQGSRGGKSLEKWVYYGSESVPVRTIGLGVGYGYGGGYGYCGPGSFYDVGYDVAYRDYVAATAEFENGRVISWERNSR